mmetsp:Transcript_99399/g.310300  ORF Transcript_99399/g.310300 Transcript_99399/m.310300 type:complete len:261 (+) Transcript_99399:1549-2331(+)
MRLRDLDDLLLHRDGRHLHGPLHELDDRPLHVLLPCLHLWPRYLLHELDGLDLRHLDHGLLDERHRHLHNPLLRLVDRQRDLLGYLLVLHARHLLHNLGLPDLRNLHNSLLDNRLRNLHNALTNLYLRHLHELLDHLYLRLFADHRVVLHGLLLHMLHDLLDLRHDDLLDRRRRRWRLDHGDGLLHDGGGHRGGLDDDRLLHHGDRRCLHHPLHDRGSRVGRHPRGCLHGGDRRLHRCHWRRLRSGDSRCLHRRHWCRQR